MWFRKLSKKSVVITTEKDYFRDSKVFLNLTASVYLTKLDLTLDRKDQFIRKVKSL